MSSHFCNSYSNRNQIDSLCCPVTNFVLCFVKQNNLNIGPLYAPREHAAPSTPSATMRTVSLLPFLLKPLPEGQMSSMTIYRLLQWQTFNILFSVTKLRASTLHSVVKKPSEVSGLKTPTWVRQDVLYCQRWRSCQDFNVPTGALSLSR